MPRLIDDLRAPGAQLGKPHFVPGHLEAEWQRQAIVTHNLMMPPELPVLRSPRPRPNARHARQVSSAVTGYRLLFKNGWHAYHPVP